MNFFNNMFGPRQGGSDGNGCCSIIWILLLLSVCGNCNFNICDLFNNECLMLIILLLLLSNCGCGDSSDMGGCRG